MSILSENQKRVLVIIASDDALAEHFYLTGGTALAEYYLHHRLSEDLDFFSEREFDPQSISAFFKKVEKEAGIQSVEQGSFCRDHHMEASLTYTRCLDIQQLQYALAFRGNPLRK